MVHQWSRSVRRTVTIEVFAVTLVMIALAGLVPATPTAAVDPTATPPGMIDPTVIPKWVNQITGPPPVYLPTPVYDGGVPVRYDYDVQMDEKTQQLLPPGFPETPVWGYGGHARDALTGADLGYVLNSPGPSFEATRGIPNEVTWRNLIESPYMFPVDPTIHWADPNGMGMPEPPFEPYPSGYEEAQSPAPLVPHLHGGEVPSAFDGGPEAWFTYNGIHGANYSSLPGAADNEAIYWYPNGQPATTLWYHDHGLGVTRINVMSGLAGFYLLRDPLDPAAEVLPKGMYEQPIVIQDRIFNTDGSLWFPADGVNPDDHPYWQPEFFGNTIMVNGLVWPNMDVTQGWYRFRLLDGSNARVYTLQFIIPKVKITLPFWVIGSDGGYLISPQLMTQLTIAPGERVDLLMDFSALPVGTTVLLKNTAKAPFPFGTAPEPRTEGQIVRFTVKSTVHEAGGYRTGEDLIASLPTPLNPTLGTGTFPTLPAPPPENVRVHTLWEVMGALGPLMVTLDGQMWSSPMSEFPEQGSTEDWVVFDATGDTHPIHLHLVQFQIVYRQKFNVAKYTADWIAVNGGMMPPFMDPTVNVPGWTVYLQGMPKAPAPNEMGWKDTIQMNPGEVTVIRVRYAGLDGNPYPFDPTSGPGYVWHCHIIDHEDNEMMRPYVVVKPEP